MGVSGKCQGCFNCFSRNFQMSFKQLSRGFQEGFKEVSRVSHEEEGLVFFVRYVYVPNSKSVVHFLLLDFGWLVTIIWMAGDHPGDGD